MKKLLSILAAVAMLVAMLPTAAFAASNVATVSTYDELVAAIADPAIETIEATTMIRITVDGGELDFGNKTLTSAADFAPENGHANFSHLLQIGNEVTAGTFDTGDVTIKNVNIVTTEANKHGINVVGGSTLVLENVTIDHTYSRGGAPLVVSGSNVTIEGTFGLTLGANSWYGVNVDPKGQESASLTVEEGAAIEVEAVVPEQAIIDVDNSSEEKTVEVEFAANTTVTSNTDSAIVDTTGAADNTVDITVDEDAGVAIDPDTGNVVTAPTTTVTELADLETGKSTIVIVAEGAKLASKNGFTTVTFLATVDGEDYYLVTAAETTVERTEVLTTKVGDADAVDAYFINIVLPTVDPEEPKDLGYFMNAVGSVAYIQAGDDGISADAYNEAKETGKEKIVIVMDDSWGYIVLYRGDYTKLNIKEDILFNIAAIAFEVDNELHNAVLDTLGNDKVDPLYIVMENNDLSKVASKPEIKLNLNDYFEGEGLEDWLWNNGTSNLTLMKYTAETDDADATVAIVAEGLALDSIQNKYMTLSLTEAGVYFLLPAADAVVPEVPADDDETEEKPNADTGANDLAAAAIAFAVIAIAAGISKKVK